MCIKTMIDSYARKKALELLEQVKNQMLTNWLLENNWPQSNDDPALNCILRWIWTLYDDDVEVMLADVITGKNRVIFDRCCNFLGTNVEFPLKDISIEDEQRIKNEWGKEWRCDCTIPEDECWPFPK